MTLKTATIMALVMTCITLVADLITWIPRFYYFELTSWLMVHVLWLVSLIIFFGILLRNQIAKGKPTNE